MNFDTKGYSCQTKYLSRHSSKSCLATSHPAAVSIDKTAAYIYEASIKWGHALLHTQRAVYN